MVLELVASGRRLPCGATLPRSARATRPARLARDIVALDLVDLGAPHAELGPTTIEPTVVRARRGAQRRARDRHGGARRALDAVAPASEIVAPLRAVLASEVRVVSDRLRPRSTAARRAPRGRRRARAPRGALLRVARRCPTWRSCRRSRRSRSARRHQALAHRRRDTC
jgi:hypothetical protein